MSDAKEARYAAIDALTPKINAALEALGLSDVKVMRHDLGMAVLIRASTNLPWLSDEEFSGDLKVAQVAHAGS